jgi:uncharacterized membrane protein YkvI
MLDFTSIVSNTGGFLNTSLKSPFWTALIIVLIMITIIIVMYPAKYKALTSVIRIFIYGFVFVLIIMYLHDNNIKNEWEKEHEDKNSKKVMNNLEGFLNNDIPDDVTNVDDMRKLLSTPNNNDTTKYNLLNNSI